MAFFKFNGPYRVTYPDFEITVSPGDVVDFGAVVPPADGQWSANSGPATNAAAPVGQTVGPVVVAPTDGQVLTWSSAAGRYVPAAIPTTGGGAPLVSPAFTGTPTVNGHGIVTADQIGTAASHAASDFDAAGAAGVAQGNAITAAHTDAANQIATQAASDASVYATQTQLGTYAPLASPALTGTPTINGQPAATVQQAAGAAAGLALVFGA